MLNKILLQNKNEYNDFVKTGELIYNSNLYNDLFDYFMNNTTDFYDVMKAGDANEYMVSQLSSISVDKNV